ncbi:MAG: DegT/DnrJ/EryC1/StrS family aminotransferase [Candidatus Acidiferrales bacterium]
MKSGVISLRSGLAIDGDTPFRQRPFAPWPCFGQEEMEAAAAVLRSGKVNYWTGEEGRLFEQEFAAFTGTQYAVALANGTVALELALYALGIGLGDEVIVPSRTFIASASCAVMRGAVPICVDVDRNSQTLTPETIRPALSRRTKAIIAVHLAGWPCDMDSILSLARPLGIKVIEDCAQALGATYKDRPVGSLGDVAAFSFCQDKILTSGGEGGMITTNDEEVWNRAWSFKDHGKSFEGADHRQHPAEFRWLHDSFGTNWRLTEMQSAIGRVLLRKLPQMISKRRALASILTNGFSRNPLLRITVPPDDLSHAYYKYYVFLRPERLANDWNRDRMIAAISAEGIPCFNGSCSEIYLEKAFPDYMRPQERLKIARELAETSLMFLVHPTLTPEDMEDTYSAVEKVARAAAR